MGVIKKKSVFRALPPRWGVGASLACRTMTSGPNLDRSLILIKKEWRESGGVDSALRWIISSEDPWGPPVTSAASRLTAQQNLLFTRPPFASLSRLYFHSNLLISSSRESDSSNPRRERTLIRLHVVVISAGGGETGLWSTMGKR